jgi:lysozyme
MQVNAKGVALIKGFESCRLNAYQDGGGVWTIGWGHTEGVKPGDTLTQPEADELFERDLCIREVTLTRVLEGIPTTSNQFAAMCSLAYNVGFGDPNRVPPIPGLKTSTVLKRHKLGNYPGAAKAFALWNKDNGKVVRGLTRRRAAEAALYLEPDAAPILRPMAPVAPVDAPPSVVTPAPVSDSQIPATPAQGCLMALLTILGVKL